MENSPETSPRIAITNEMFELAMLKFNAFLTRLDGSTTFAEVRRSIQEFAITAPSGEAIILGIPEESDDTKERGQTALEVTSVSLETVLAAVAYFEEQGADDFDSIKERVKNDAVANAVGRIIFSQTLV